MSKDRYRYLAKCLAASVSAHFIDNTVEHEMRVYKDQEPGELYYAMASLLVRALLGKIPEDIERLKDALEGYPK
jgi:hypothetical protein